LTEHRFYLEEVSPLEFYGVNNARLDVLKGKYPHVLFVARGNDLVLKGPASELRMARDMVETLLEELNFKGSLPQQRFTELLASADGGELPDAFSDDEDYVLHGTRGTVIRAKTAGQREILKAAAENDIVFALGPAGTGKTYMGVALAVRALKEKEIKKIFLVRPAVEAGETLGFLPGDLKEKVDPYLRPLYDALEDMIHFDKLKNYLEKNIIEIAPLAYMRGRTLSNCYVILDEAQNATEMQFRMFLTRLGKGGKIIITGDDSQIDLPRNQRSGLLQAKRILQGVPGIGFVRMKPSDVVRHRLVKEIIAAYKKVDDEKEAQIQGMRNEGGNGGRDRKVGEEPKREEE
jgi:phosphate starvation-inducible protein PhoH and related proteins